MHHCGAELSTPSPSDSSPIPHYEVDLRNTVIMGGQGSIPIRIYRLKGVVGKLPTLFSFHGGAFVMGSLDSSESYFPAFELCVRAQIQVIYLEYRLVTDEWKFPAPQIDAEDAVRHAIDNLNQFDIDTDAIFVGGASAGCSLAASTVIRLSLAGIQVNGLISIYPIVHKIMQPWSDELKEKLAALEEGTFFPPEYYLWRTQNVGGDSSNPRLAPDAGFLGDMAEYPSMPPILIINAELDSAQAFGEAFAHRLTSVGCDVTMRTKLGAFHA